jgi:restriction system protein
MRFLLESTAVQWIWVSQQALTTSGYTTQAVQFARSVEGIVLVDGYRLSGLMIDHEIGVNARVLRIPKIDSDYFDEEAA